ncbi:MULTISPECIES: hypothetical protein [Clostridium]|uniref:Uncharacterized protein n=1 Tax=Clostridium frigoriphilum TaxID=443253 RepID=A0ABU7UXC0_9CLOT|nr:hypothetical protein [Clostridium sp. DSM 17811]MBU3101973.1 hypothetical protein [Clostridium sp. DSM 17811]
MDAIMEFIFDMLIELLTGKKPKRKLIESINSTKGYNKDNYFDKAVNKYSKHSISTESKNRETKVITEMLEFDIKSGMIGYTENGSGRLIILNNK